MSESEQEPKEQTPTTQTSRKRRGRRKRGASRKNITTVGMDEVKGADVGNSPAVFETDATMKDTPVGKATGGDQGGSKPSAGVAAGGEVQNRPKKRKRRRKRGRGDSPETQAASLEKAETDQVRPEPQEVPDSKAGPGTFKSEDKESRLRKRSRRGSRGRGRSRNGEKTLPPETEPAVKQDTPTEAKKADSSTAPDSDKKKSRRKKASPTASASRRTMKTSAGADDGRVMIINAAEGEECRIAILHQDRLEELFIERASAESHVGNIYKGRITNVEPSIQAAFVDFGLAKNGFLHISDLQPQYFPDNSGQMEKVGRKTPRRERPPIQKCLRRGQEVLVQIIKEGIGTKGPTLTTYISIPGRYLVMMPGMNRLGVSRKIEDEDARRKMRKVLDELDLPKDMGFILRTAGLDKTKRDLQRDQMYLQRLWKRVAQRIKSERAPCELYQESDLVIRTIRDVCSSDFSRIIVDDEVTADKVREFLAIAMPRTSTEIEVYTGREPVFHKYHIEAEIARINDRHVPLPSGGSLVIDTSEAMVTIDVNSGRFREHDDAEETAYRTDLEAAAEIARQLRLRDLGGLILCDFIDLRQDKHCRGVEKALRDALKEHKERAKCLRMSQFGIIEMTRQRMRPSIKRSIYQDCPHCHGSGVVKNAESMTLDIMRLLNLAAHHDQVESIEVRVSPQVAFHLQNRKRPAIHRLERDSSRRIVIRADSNMGLDQYAFECLDRRGGVVHVIDPPASKAGRPRPEARRPDQNRGPESAQTERDKTETMFE